MSASTSTSAPSDITPVPSAAAATAPGSRGGVNRVLLKLEASVEAGDYYEAHQMYRTLYFRYLRQKRFADCLDLLYNGSLKFLKNEQFTSGADLGILVVDTLEKRGEDNDVELWIGRICELLRLIHTTVVERETLLVRAVKWSSNTTTNKFGHPLLHRHIAEIMWSEGNTEQARHHFLLSRDGVGYGQMLVELSTSKGLPSEIDLFIAQVVLQQLCIKDKLSAAETFKTYTRYHPKIACSEPPFQLPLLNFTYFLLKAVEAGKLPVYKSLCDLYKTALSRDPSYQKYLQRIGEFFFGVAPAAQRGGGGIFGDLINQLFMGMDGLEDEESPDGAASSVDADLD